jgi:hypothetical protein
VCEREQKEKSACLSSKDERDIQNRKGDQTTSLTTKTNILSPHKSKPEGKKMKPLAPI